MASTHSGSDEPLYIMPDGMRQELGAPVGIIVSTKEELARAVADADFLVTVGDVVTLDILELGIMPDLSVVDFRTKRMPLARVQKIFSRHEQPVLRVRNPAGQITRALWDAIKDGYENPRHLRIVVEGEEDLAALACIALAPPGTTVIYGIPNRGASVHRVSDELKALVDRVLESMEA